MKKTKDMKKFTAIIIAATLAASMYAAEEPQFGTKHIVKGEVLDSLTREAEPMAVLQFFKDGNDKPVAFTTTDENGRFSQQIDGSGDYYLYFSNVGRKSRRVPFKLNGQGTVDLGAILIQDDVQTLQGAGVMALRPLVKMDVDKMSYDVSGDVDSKASTVLDMLRKVPMVTVDGQDNISVNGSSSFQVTVDGKPSQMLSANPSQIFKMMPASAVSSIEVITNPGVKYDAEGVGGVLNIKMARQADGSKASADGQYGTVRLMGGNQGGGGGLFYSMQKGKFTMSFNGNAMYRDLGGTTMELSRDQLTAAGTFHTTTYSETGMRAPIALGNFSASYEIDSLNLVSATAGLMSIGTVSDGTGRTGMGLFSYETVTSSKMRTNRMTGSVDYQHNWAGIPDRTFTLSYQFSGAPTVDNSTNRFLNPVGSLLDLTDRSSNSSSMSQDHTIQADFTTPLGMGQSLSTGAKYIHRHNSSDSRLSLWDGSSFVLNEAGSLKYDFYNRIGALYTEWNGNFGKLGLKAGARYEYTSQSYTTGGSGTFSTAYGDLVPTASIQYNIGPASNLGLSYNMRISRPGISYLNPYRDTSDPTSVSYGNSSLETEHAHNVNLVYNYFSAKWIVNLTGRYTYNGGGISSYSFYDSDNILNTTYGNIVTARSAGLNAFVNWNAGSRTRIYVNGGTSWNGFSSEVLEQENHGVSYNILAGAQQTLPSDFRLSGNLISMGRTYNLQGWSSGIRLAMLSLTKSVLADRLSFTLMGMMPLSRDGKMQMTTYTAGKDFTNTSTVSIPLANVNLSISFSFGRQRGISVKKAGRTISNDEQLNVSSTAEQLNSATGSIGGGM